MDPRFSRFSGSQNEIHFGDEAFSVFPDGKFVVGGPRFGNNFVGNGKHHDQVSRYNNNTAGFLDHNAAFGGIKFLPNGSSPSDGIPSSSVSTTEEELAEDCDLSDAILGFISQVLMEEDMEDKTCMLQESLDLQAAEKSFYDVLGKKYPPSPEQGLTSYCQDTDSPDDYPSYLSHNNSLSDFSDGSFHLLDPSRINSPASYSASNLQVLPPSSRTSPTTSPNNVVDGFLDSPISSSQVTADFSNRNEMMSQFRKGVEEASKFLPQSNRLLVSYNQDSKTSEAGETNSLTGSSRVRKNPHGEADADELEERSSKQAAIYPESTLRSNEIDLILLCSMGEGEVALQSLRDTLQKETSKDALKSVEQKGSSKGRGRNKKQNKKKEVIDLRTLLISCAQAVAADDRRNANELLKQIRQHASPFGDGNQRLAHCFANGLEARLAGTGSQIHKALLNKKTSSADYIKAYHLYIGSCPFRKISNLASNRTIMEKSKDSVRVHVIDFGILYGFQWPTFIQRIAAREGGPPRLRITGIEFPQPGFRPAQRIEETGCRLADYARAFNVPFEYNAIAKRWENIKVEDLKIEKDEFLAVNCMYRSRNLLDETVTVDSARNVVLNLIRKINPDVFVHGVLNGSYNAPFFVTRFREALFHFSALFDMLDTNVPRERSERMLMERDLFGREALNVIACEGWERVERPETYKQWHVRNLRAGFVPIPLSRYVVRRACEKVKLYHKDFLIDEDGQWLVQGWKGRIIYAISCWVPA